jgi:prephenate dehydrogenase
MIRVSIIGLGLIGGSLAKSFKNTYADNIEITGYDSPDVLDEAIEVKVIDKKVLFPEDAADSNIIFLCLPTELSLTALSKLAPEINEDTIISDVAGVKGIFEMEWSALKSKGKFIGGHPMTGKERGGFENSDPLLFENSVYILSDKKIESKNYSLFIELINSLGARIRFLDPFLHDEIVANVSHLPQLLSVALVNAASETKGDINYLDFAAGGFRDMTRIASSDFKIWQSVIKHNRDSILRSIESFEAVFKKVKSFVKNDDYKSLAELFESSRLKRDEIPKNTKGFINPLTDIFVFVKDEPGVLSRLTSILFENNINIKDLELLKIREGTGGTFRISFESQAEADTAEKLIEGLGFRTK